MLRKLMTAAVVTTALVALSPDLGQAHSDKPHPFKSASIEWDPEGSGHPTPAKLLVGHDGNNYTHLVGDISTRFKLQAEVKSGHRIYGYGITMGDPDMADSIPNNMIGFQTGAYEKVIDTHATFSMDAAQAVSAGTPGITPNAAQNAIDMCNEAFPTPPDVDSGAGQLELTVHGVFSRGKWIGYQFLSWNGWYPAGEAKGRPAYDHATFPVSVVCLNKNNFRVGQFQPEPKIGFDHGDFLIKDAKLFLTTITPLPSQSTSLQPGGCKNLKTTVRFETNQTGPVTFELHRFPGGKSLHTVNSEFDAASGKYYARYHKHENFQTTTSVQYMAKSITPSAGNTGWKSITIHCGGGLSMNPNPSQNPDDQPAFPAATYDGEITVADSALTPKGQCPRQGQAVFKINSNKSSVVDYKVDCTGGRSWTGTMQMFANGPGKYQGTAAKTFDVEKTENVACVLKRIDGNNSYVLYFNAHQFSCANPTMPPSTTDLTPNPGRPDDDLPPQAATLTGDFGIADHGAPKCPRTAKALVTFKSPKADNIHYSLDCKYQNKSGVVTPQPSPQGGYMAATLVTLDVTQTLNDSCTLRTVAPYGPKDHVTREHQFVCSTPSGHGATSGLQIEPKPTDANKARIDALKIARDKAVAERLRKARIAAEQAAKRKRQQDAARKAQLQKLQQERARAAAAAAAKARADAIRALTAKRRNKVMVAPKRRTTTTAPAVNRLMMMRAR